jgi:ubiquinone/menaquinone biosynthesis C-methylase UbiE
VSRHSHPIFARYYIRAARTAERYGGAELRGELLSGLSGEILEVGIGSALSLPYYSPDVRLIAVEPDAFLLGSSARVASNAALDVSLIRATGESLPLRSGSFDACVISLVLCSIEDPSQVLSEMRRVLRPGGIVRFHEHIRSTSPRKAFVQDMIDIVRPRFAGGCRCGRDLLELVRRSGFEIQSQRTFQFQPRLLDWPVSDHAIGSAAARDS